MGFFTKNREKGVKSMAKEKKQKTTKANGEGKVTIKTQDKKALMNEVKTVDKKATSEKESTTTNSISNTSSSNSMPWWVSDACFIVEQKKISAHKVVVSSRSKVLGSLLESAPNGTIIIKDFTHHIFSQLVRWIYGGKFEVNKDDSKELGKCAKLYQVQDLYEVCQQLAGQNVMMNNETNSIQQTKAVEEEEMICVSNITIDSSSSLTRNLHICTEPVVLAAIAASAKKEKEETIHHEEYTIELPTPCESDEIISPSPIPTEDDTMTSTISSSDEYDIASNNQDFGMSIWSEDPALYLPEQYGGVESFQITEIY